MAKPKPYLNLFAGFDLSVWVGEVHVHIIPRYDLITKAYGTPRILKLRRSSCGTAVHMDDMWIYTYHTYIYTILIHDAAVVLYDGVMMV